MTNNGLICSAKFGPLLSDDMDWVKIVLITNMGACIKNIVNFGSTSFSVLVLLPKPCGGGGFATKSFHKRNASLFKIQFPLELIAKENTHRLKVNSSKNSSPPPRCRIHIETLKRKSHFHRQLFSVIHNARLDLVVSWIIWIEFRFYFNLELEDQGEGRFFVETWKAPKSSSLYCGSFFRGNKMEMLWWYLIKVIAVIKNGCGNISNKYIWWG